MATTGVDTPPRVYVQPELCLVLWCLQRMSKCVDSVWRLALLEHWCHFPCFFNYRRHPLLTPPSRPIAVSVLNKEPLCGVRTTSFFINVRPSHIDIWHSNCWAYIKECGPAAGFKSIRVACRNGRDRNVAEEEHWERFILSRAFGILITCLLRS